MMMKTNATAHDGGSAKKAPSFPGERTSRRTPHGCPSTAKAAVLCCFAGALWARGDVAARRKSHPTAAVFPRTRVIYDKLKTS